MGYDFNVTPVQVENGTDYQARKDAAAARKIELQQRQMQLDEAKKAQKLKDTQEAVATSAYGPKTTNLGNMQLPGGYGSIPMGSVQGPAQLDRGAYTQGLQKAGYGYEAMQADQQFQQQDFEHQKALVAYQEQVFKMNKEQREALNGSLGALDKYFGAVDNADPKIQPSIYAQAIQAAKQDPDPFVQHMAANAPQQFDPQSWQVIRGQYLDMKRVTDEANKKLELGSKTVQTAEGVQQFNPGTGQYDQNIGKLPKTVAPGVNVTVGGGAGQDVQLIDQKKQPHLFGIAQDLAYGKLTLQQMKSLYGYSRNSSAQRQALYATAQELNPNFDPAQFEMGFKFAANPKVRQQMASLDNVASGVKDLLKLSDEADRSGVKLFNDLIIKGGAQVSGKKYSNLQTARTAFADELSGALGYGSATDMSREMGFNMTDPNLSAEAFRSAIQDVVVPFVQRKKASLLGQMGPYGGNSGPTLTNQNPGTGQRPPLGSFEK